jgi:putative peptidoglycan lipid II flippase
MALVPPLIVAGFVLRGEIVYLLFSGGAYSPRALHDTASVFGMILLGLPAQTLIVVFATLFVVHKKTVFPMIIGFTNVALNVALNLALRPSLGVGGIALSTTITYTILLVAYFAAARWRWGSTFEGRLPHLAFRVAVSSGLAAATAFVVVRALPGVADRAGAATHVAIVTSAVLVAYVIALIAVRDPIASSLAARIRTVPLRGQP